MIEVQKIYLKYDEYTPPVECDFGFIKEMVYMGCIYPILKKNYKMFSIMFPTELAVVVLIMCFIPSLIGLLISIIMIFVMNTLFAANYNMIVIERLLKRGYVPQDYNSSNLLIKKGIYFKLQ